MRLPAGVIVACCTVAATLTWAPGLTARSSAIWRGDYESGNFRQWSEVQVSPENSEADVVRAPVRQGRVAARFVTYASRRAPNGDRAEVSTTVSRTGAFEGTERYYAWSTMFPRAGNPRGFWPNGGDFNVFTQWHNSVDPCGNNLQLGIDATSRRHRNRIYSDLSIRRPGDCDTQTGTLHSILGTLRFDSWYDFIVHVKWSSRRQTGWYEIWMNGRHVVDKKFGATMWDSSGAYWKQGFYRAAFDATNTVYQDGAISASNLGTVTRDFRLRLASVPRALPNGSISVEAKSFPLATVEVVIRDGQNIVGRGSGRADSNGLLHADIAVERLPRGLHLRAYLRANVSSRLPRATRRAVFRFAVPAG
jgi:polysaccharide lyase-like protein